MSHLQFVGHRLSSGIADTKTIEPPPVQSVVDKECSSCQPHAGSFLVNLPNSCLCLSFSFMLHEIYNHKDSSRLYTFIKIVSKYVATSSSLRTVFLEAVNVFLTQAPVTFDFPKHQALLTRLLQIQSSCVYSVSFIALNDKVLFTLPEGKVRSASLRFSLQPKKKDIISFISKPQFKSVEQFSASFRMSLSLLSEIGTTLTSLVSLIITRNLFQTEVMIPRVFTNLRILRVNPVESPVTHPFYSLSVENMVSLRELSCWNCIDLKGLSRLQFLTTLILFKVNAVDDLHTDARLAVLRLDRIQASCAEHILSFRDQLANCKLSCSSTMIPDSVSWVFKTILSVYSFPPSIYPREFSVGHDAPLVEAFAVDLNCNHIVEFGHCMRLATVSISSVPVFVTSVLFIKSLSLHNIDVDAVIMFLNNSPYLRFLHVDRFENNKPVGDTHISSLNHLKTFIVENDTASSRRDIAGLFLQKFPLLPRLTRLELNHVDDFNLALVTTKFPVVEYLSLRDCALNDALLGPNTTLRELFIENLKKHTSANFDDCLLNFLRLQDLTLHIRSFDSIDKLFIPTTVQLLRLYVPFSMVKDSLNTVSKLSHLSGALVVEDKDKGVAREWLRLLNSTREPQLFCNLSLEGYFSEIPSESESSSPSPFADHHEYDEDHFSDKVEEEYHFAASDPEY
ncbi:hypothetical protein RCL1_004034 [Eukaryota sp. TZLM3-RCL]